MSKIVNVNVRLKVTDDMSAEDAVKIVNDSLDHTAEYDNQAMIDIFDFSVYTSADFRNVR